MKPAMYIFVNRGLDMSPGKMAAQVAHGAVEAYRISHGDMIKEWYKGGHHTKLVMEARDEQHLQNIEHYLHDRGFATVRIIDEGRTEIAPHSFTVLAVEIVDRDDENTALSFSDFRTYKNETSNVPKTPNTGKSMFGRKKKKNYRTYW